MTGVALGAIVRVGEVGGCPPPDAGTAQFSPQTPFDLGSLTATVLVSENVTFGVVRASVRRTR